MRRVVTLAALALTLSACGIQPTGQAAYIGPSMANLTEACHTAVAERLKAPGTARYSSEAASRSDTAGTMTGAVDAENGFGALLRYRYTCAAARGAGWRVTGVEFSDW